ncbi:MAG: DUF4203 domain-containing protein [Candidatus Brocadiia bacterium]
MGEATDTILKHVGDPGVVGVVALFGVGAFCCFLGYRYFRFSAAVAGMVVGTELVGQLCLSQGLGAMATTILALLGGGALAALFVVFTFLAIFGLGAMLAASFVCLAARAAHASIGPLYLVLAALIGGFGALLLRQFAVVVSTSFYGGVAAIAGLFALIKGTQLRAAVGMAASPRRVGASGIVIYLLCVAVIVTGGIVVQFRYGRNKRVDGK